VNQAERPRSVSLKTQAGSKIKNDKQVASPCIGESTNDVVLNKKKAEKESRPRYI
jgi:hypothetical protein